MENLRIKELLKEQGKTMQQLADELGINRVNLSNSLNGNPTIKRLEEVAKCLHVDIRDLFAENKVSTIPVFGLIRINQEMSSIENFEDLERVYQSAKSLIENKEQSTANEF